MTILGIARPATALAVLLLAACAAGGAARTPPVGTGPPDVGPPDAPAALVLRVEHVGGFLPPHMIAGRLPLVSVYADGRVISEGPVPAIHPGPALPNVQVQEIDPAEVQVLADRAQAAGVGDTSDLGMPPVADAPSTRFTLVTASGTQVREVYALWESPQPGRDPGGSGLTTEQEAARARLATFLTELQDLGRGPEVDTELTVRSYVPEAVAALATPWIDPEDELDHPERAWPGPALPGEPMGPGPLGLGCVVASGEQARAVLAAAGSANVATPWTSDGARWSVSIRPLLPDESGCADLGD